MSEGVFQFSQGKIIIMFNGKSDSLAKSCVQQPCRSYGHSLSQSLGQEEQLFERLIGQLNQKGAGFMFAPKSIKSH